MDPANLSVLSLAGALGAIKTIHTEVTLQTGRSSQHSSEALPSAIWASHFDFSSTPRSRTAQPRPASSSTASLRTHRLKILGQMLLEYSWSSRLLSILGRDLKQDFLGGSWKISVVGWHYADFGSSFERGSDSVSRDFGGILMFCWLQASSKSLRGLPPDAQLPLPRDWEVDNWVSSSVFTKDEVLLIYYRYVSLS